MERIEIRIHGAASKPTLVYLPGLHADWTLVASFRAALRNRVRFVEFAYPRISSWPLHDYAIGVLDALRENDITSGWLLAESFSSLVAWSMTCHAGQKGFGIEGLILAGGFVRYPYPLFIPVVHWINRRIPMWGLRLLLRAYSGYAAFRHRSAPETLVSVSDFVARRSEEADRQAICGRYDLIASSDFREAARQFGAPLYQIYGFFDPIVPWLPVRRWLKRHCKSHRQSRMIWNADHNVLGTAPRLAAEQIVEWMACR